MSNKLQLELCGNRAGRMLLHVLTVRRNRRLYRAALRGIGRELAGMVNDAANSAAECLAVLEGE